MTGQGAFSSELILATAGTYAAGAVLRQQEAKGDERTEGRFGDLVSDTEVRLRYLAEALALDRPALFLQHLAWHKVALVSRGFTIDALLRNLQCMREELADRLPRGAGDAPGRLIEEALEFVKAAPESLPSHIPEKGPLAGEAGRYLLAILEGRRLDALSLVDSLVKAGTSVADIHTHLLTPVQRELGRMWHQNEIHIAEEHFGSRVTEEVLARLRAHIVVPEEPGPRVLAASVDGDLHDIGIAMVADHFALAGWEPLRLGASTPSEDLAQAVVDFGAQALALSVHLALQVRSAARLIGTIRDADECAAVPIIVGGSPFAQVADLWEVIGADAAASDGAEAVETASRLLGR